MLFEYEGGRTALLSSAVRLALTNDAWIYGTNGRIHVPRFLSADTAFLYRADGTSLEFKAPRKQLGYIHEIEEAMDCIEEGRIESSIMPLEETLDIMKTLDSVHKQWGLEYPETIQ